MSKVDCIYCSGFNQCLHEEMQALPGHKPTCILLTSLVDEECEFRISVPNKPTSVEGSSNGPPRPRPPPPPTPPKPRSITDFPPPFTSGSQGGDHYHKFDNNIEEKLDKILEQQDEILQRLRGLFVIHPPTPEKR